jgi:hypothetical protein
MRNCENCGSEIPEDAPYCYYCGQKVNIKTHSPTTDRDAVEGSNQPPPPPPAPPTNPAGSARSVNPVLLVVLLIAVISALVLGGVIAVRAVTPPPSAVTPTPQATATPSPTHTPTATPSPTPTPTQQPAQTPMLHVSPTSFSQTSCTQNSDTSWKCTATVTEDTGSQGVNWSAKSDLSGVTFTPPSGAVSVGSPNKVSITIPANDCQNSTFTFTFTGGVNSIANPWSCVAPTLTVTPPSFYVLDDCPPSQTSSGWICTVKLSSSSSNQSNLNWSVSSPVSGITFSQPTSGMLKPGESTMVNITVPSASCETNPTVSSSESGSNPVNVTWSCPPPPVPFMVTSINATVSPTTYDCQSQITFNFSATITIRPGSSGGNITYTWERSDGATMAPITISIPASQTMDTVTNTWTFSKGVPDGTYWEKVVVTSPNSISSNQATFTASC